MCGCKCGVTYDPQIKFLNTVIRPERWYCTPCCKCGLIQLTPYSREICRFPCPPRHLFPSCFPSTASVTLKNGKQIAMGELQVGDQVQTGMFKQCIYDN